MPRITRRILATLALAAALSAQDRPALPTTPTPESVASFREARLRKLHLVRPDLIHYPISFDIIC